MGRLREGVVITYLPPTERDVQVARLEEPWIGDEGPLDAGFHRGSTAEPLRPRGFAFDRRTMVVWDEAGVQILQPSEASPEVTALESKVMLRSWYKGPPRLVRIDYLERGCLLGSRYVPAPEEETDGQGGGELDA